MAGKQDAIIRYIESLNPGDRVSVRSLAGELSVSEGTAYKAIKAAESLGLVATRPKAGTVRIKSGLAAGADVPLSAVVNRLGLSVLCGGARIDAPMGRVVLGDGSPEQLLQSLRGAGRAPLCIVGDRTDIQLAAVRAGANLLISGGRNVYQSVLDAADENRVCVLVSEKDSAALLQLMCAAGSLPEDGGADAVKNWMGLPIYLYNDDIVADWHRIYRPVYSLVAKCAVVDGEQRICGTIDAMNVLAATPSHKIGSLLSADGECLTADEETPMRALAERMIAQGVGVAFITGGGKLCGTVTSGDMLRYFLYHAERGGAASPADGALEAVGPVGAFGRNIYTLRLPEGPERSEERLPELLFSALFSAARLHCESLFGAKSDFQSGTFYSLDRAPDGGELMVSSEIVNRSPSGCTIQVEIYDDDACYARSTLIACIPDGGKRKG